MRIALVHDHLTQEGGAERVLSVLHDIWPDAPIFTLVYDEQKLGKMFPVKNIHTSFLQRWPGAVKHYQWFLPLMPTATESYDLMEYDVVISSSSAMAKGIITRTNTLHLCYCHTPTRYLWSDTHRYLEELRYNSIIKKFIPLTLTRLRMWDQLAAQRPDYFIANSHDVAGRIQKYYRRTSTVIYPPVQTDQFSITSDISKYFLTGGRLVAYKRFDVVVQAFNRLGIPLTIFGSGPEQEKLQAMAKPNITFVGQVSATELAKLYQRAQAFINPQIEDFGLTAIESMASGRPVIAFNAGGARESVIDGVTGTFFDEQTWEALADTVVRFKSDRFNPEVIKKHAQQFSVEQFKQQMMGFIETQLEEKKQKRLSM